MSMDGWQPLNIQYIKRLCCVVKVMPRDTNKSASHDCVYLCSLYALCISGHLHTTQRISSTLQKPCDLAILI